MPAILLYTYPTPPSHSGWSGLAHWYWRGSICHFYMLLDSIVQQYRRPYKNNTRSVMIRPCIRLWLHVLLYVQVQWSRKIGGLGQGVTSWTSRFFFWTWENYGWLVRLGRVSKRKALLSLTSMTALYSILSTINLDSDNRFPYLLEHEAKSWIMPTLLFEILLGDTSNLNIENSHCLVQHYALPPGPCYSCKPEVFVWVLASSQCRGDSESKYHMLILHGLYSHHNVRQILLACITSTVP